MVGVGGTSSPVRHVPWSHCSSIQAGRGCVRSWEGMHAPMHACVHACMHALYASQLVEAACGHGSMGAASRPGTWLVVPAAYLLLFAQAGAHPHSHTCTCAGAQAQAHMRMYIRMHVYIRNASMALPAPSRCAPALKHMHTCMRVCIRTCASCLPPSRCAPALARTPTFSW